MNDKVKVAAIGVGAITWLETLALLLGVDGMVAAGSFSGIGVIIGYLFKGLRK